MISDNMVIQRDAAAHFYGWADAGEKVTVRFAGKEATTTAGETGRWSVLLPEIPERAKGTVTILGNGTPITVRNAVVGEVWVCAGQSNMEFTMQRLGTLAETISKADDPDIRLFDVENRNSATPAEDVSGRWVTCTPETAGAFSAVGYFFATHLRKETRWPVGLVAANWGGTPIECWMAERIFYETPGFDAVLKRWEATKAAYPAAAEKHKEALAAWKIAAEDAKARNANVPAAPREPAGGNLFGAPGAHWNAMIAPLTTYPIRGFLWYQGESNAGAGARGSHQLYRQLFQALIQSWRTEWGIHHAGAATGQEIPFYWVQLAAYRQRKPEPAESSWAEIREAQAAALELPATGMALAIDIGDANDVHPKNKQEVGRRLALIALAQTYYIDREFNGPQMSGVQVEDRSVRLTFAHADGLKTTDGGPVKGFALAGKDRKFHWAKATIEGDHVILSAEAVPEPVEVRYAWADNPEVNLVNDAGLPAAPFRTDRSIER
jgi:sialate O-acetylesterase